MQKIRITHKQPVCADNFPVLRGKKKQQNLISQWGLKILLDLRGWKKTGQKYCDFTSDKQLLASLGLEHVEDQDLTKNEFLAILEKRRAELSGKKAVANKCLRRNCQKISKYIGLNDIERDILIFTTILQGDAGCKAITSALSDLNSEEVITVLAVILELPYKEVRKALAKNGVLTQTGILSLDRESTNDLVYKLDMLEGFDDALQESGATIETMLGRYFTKTDNPQLSENNYRHVSDHFSLIRRHLKQACKHKRRGVNILLYGPPGTGKTEFSKTVSASIGKTLYEINISDDNNHYYKKKRMRAYQLAQKVLGRKCENILLFDEIDNILTDNYSFFQTNSDSDNLKALINKTLENSQVPTIWIANDLGYADRAFIRRFDIVLHLDYPPRSTRLKIMSHALRNLDVKREWLEGLAENKFIAPAVIARAAKVVSNQKQQSPRDTEKRLEKLISSTLVAMGYPRKPLIETRSNLQYRLGAVNPDHDLDAIVRGLRNRAEGRLCLYGPPGTGKTEFGHYLARQLDRPLLVRRSSDILGPYVGETEANIAKMFADAIYEDAVLLLDEADSFLRDRSDARRSWEVTQVNELLTQMEGYKGVFICSTNLMETLDTASLRRFDLKVKFDFLKPTQAWDLFQTIVPESEEKIRDKKYWQDELKKYTALTPGDFATVLRKSRINGSEICPESLLKGLAAETSFKEKSTTNRIGF